jgi:hypothetical protein
MKTPLAILALSLLSAASPAVAASAAEASKYFTANAGFSFGALAVAAGMMAAVEVSSRRLRRVAVAASDPLAWRERVLKNLDADLQRFSRQLRRAA